MIEVAYSEEILEIDNKICSFFILARFWMISRLVPYWLLIVVNIQSKDKIIWLFKVTFVYDFIIFFRTNFLKISILALVN